MVNDLNACVGRDLEGLRLWWQREGAPRDEVGEDRGDVVVRGHNGQLNGNMIYDLHVLTKIYFLK
jgi:hypothetical protein